MFTAIVFTYTATRITKDSQVIAFGQSGSTPIPVLKIFVFISSLSYTMFYAYISNKIEKARIFYSICIIYFAFFFTFRYVLMPNHEAIILTSAYNAIYGLSPSLKSFALVIRDWDVSIFYIASELFGSIMISSEFYILANNIMKIQEAKRFYGVFGLFASFGTLMAGIYVRRITSMLKTSATAGVSMSEAWLPSLTYIIYGLFIALILVAASYTYINLKVLTDPKLVDQEQLKSQRTKLKMTIGQAVKFLSKSPHMRFLTVMIFSYGASMNIMELMWKNSWRVYFNTPAEIANFQSGVITLLALSTTFVTLFVSHNMLRIFSWRFVAYSTPVLLFATSVPFITSMLFGIKLDNYIFYISGIQLSPGFLPIYAGAFWNIISKTCKYALFDPTKEIVYINRDKETKSKGKVSVEILGARFSKLAGAFAQFFSGILPISFFTQTCLVSGFALGIGGFWLYGIHRLGFWMDKEAEV